MAVLETAPFPLVAVDFVANAQNEWVALSVRADRRGERDTLRAMFATPDLLTAIAPLDCVLLLDSPGGLDAALLPLLPANRVVLVFAGRALGAPDDAQAALELARRGYRVLVDCSDGVPANLPPALRAVACDCAGHAPEPASLPALFGPHLARNVGTAQRFLECETAGFTWFSGQYPFDVAEHERERARDGTSRRRLLALLALLARDADTHELEAQIKQDPVLSFHLLKLANSAAFAVNTPITGFAQAITLLGRRQLQRWLQLLLYARDAKDGPPNLLLPLAALRGAQLEHLCKLDGGSRDEQDLAFMCGVFSLLDRLFGTPMDEIVGSLRLPRDVLDALLRGEGRLGQRLRMAGSIPETAALEAANLSTQAWWSSLLHAYHWAIQVGRNV